MEGFFKASGWGAESLLKLVEHDMRLEESVGLPEGLLGATGLEGIGPDAARSAVVYAGQDVYAVAVGEALYVRNYLLKC
ncbi:hypothetical protein HYY74_07515 [Candidatus Woesearchaeota archaeon]|nr:hypothetical protein [Candidatus Woesearchaeota archaeon]